MAITKIDETLCRHEDDIVKVLVDQGPIMLQVSGILTSRHAFSCNLKWVVDDNWEWRTAITAGDAGDNRRQQSVLSDLRATLTQMEVRHRVIFRSGVRTTWNPDPEASSLMEKISKEGMIKWQSHCLSEFPLDGGKPFDVCATLETLLHAFIADARAVHVPNLVCLIDRAHKCMMEEGVTRGTRSPTSGWNLGHNAVEPGKKPEDNGAHTRGDQTDDDEGSEGRQVLDIDDDVIAQDVNDENRE